MNKEINICIECGHEIWGLPDESFCDYCRIGMAGGFTTRPTVEDLAKSYWEINKELIEIKHHLKAKIKKIANEPLRTMTKDNPQYVLGWNTGRYVLLKDLLKKLI